ncbi:MAG: tRNA (adenosine(37)-N6)-dimethylallyltransferase MiaA [Candidatus Staskawiczbacteria bacterium RIFOXYB1_FULL_37_44]|uniref:tRNA dimethylallyltransferase n=1 Tax=Candidatus Staskawiczbacteria bacterium RIFOXYB1_FULL_37_44 TaxID=1802223 RepID=A0A1G2IWG0_9BACT|nr:MAG: tRNA (adenosine(37)-N6)-dimethylallyltransferase MiaA [Candidatus Staskawiczbacteria bacterium RIFOXYB1_FULL_37_44]OGZ83889.1 MAG: tRNA (adenosine(37)-N6)-dimethylallyltransferase MiaA [Candidatus Staskawiczbacteria bacterium RIFOXYC1_FULL_37_52]OGZ87092.1 MAG: tRNA (adenosine(37)-N6)-dimethylallyltransferase MiaA [Candidatus Staskawiczbacteria bacterium RIFOXYC2_FULL_37_19]OGZ89396.1 MAG: tRNA (adenosine(37)-N6)-dimethylallyltransferase MiaA [Candidatus Staskawiczbacteria bacterium RIFO
MNKLIVIVGPTASGKTELSIKLAKKYNAEIVSADSRQIYREMDIGTAKPLDLREIPHWLLDIKNPNRAYTVAEYKKDAVKIIRDIQKRGKLPILTGGTGLYVKAIVENLDIPKIKANPLLRAKIEKEVKEKGLEYIFQKLVKLDPEAAYVIDAKNPRRVIRALEITLLTKKPFSQQRKSGMPLFDILEIGISVPNENLKDRINLRVDEMIKNGLVNEVENLINKYGSKQQAFDAIGYREIIDFLKNKKTLEKATAEMKINTWHYAKRQITWFNADKKIKWIKSYKETKNLVQQFL